MTPRIYGLPNKIHKQYVPLRTIVSFCTSPTYQLSKHLSSLLSPFVGKTLSYVCNSREFAQFIINQELEDDEVLISFDVVSLFTSVPIDLALKVVRDQLEHDETLVECTYLDSENVSLLDLCLNATYLQFQNVVYQQVHESYGRSSVCHNRQHSDGRYGTKSSFNLQDSFTVLEEIC